MENPLYTNGLPDFNAVRRHFASQGGGHLRNITATGDQYEFTIVRHADGGYDAIIDRQPDYGGRPADAHSTHRLSAGNGKMRICFKNAPQDLPTAVYMALLWTEGTSWYRKHGGGWG
jgi:hypothetical protein